MPAHADINLADQGRGAYTIIIAPDASATVHRAATELSADLQQMSGAMVPVDTGRPKGPAIYVGESPATRSWGLKLSSLPAEGFVIRTRGRDLALAGRDDRGTMYAVYTFLEDNLGARWYAPDATVLPHYVAVNVPNLNVRQSPAFDYRDTDESIVSGNAAWDAHLKLDGTDVPDDPTL
ncbi:MAG: hypothetical protein LC772_05255, partial [Chloroflexi bacterium]|nr:hypothetical protein [Chloroflexota bacterium]